METTLLITASRQTVLRRHLAVIANNVANADTAGFKAQRLMVEPDPVPSRGDRPRPVSLDFVQDTATRLDTTEGGLRETGNRLDVALRGDGYLVVETADGPRYTRLGRLRVDVDGTLLGATGQPVLSAADQPIVVGADTAAITIARNGTIAGRNGVLGQLKVVRFADPSALQPAAGGLMRATEPPEPVARPDVVQGSLETSNVEPIRELTNMIDVQRAYDRTRKIIEQEDDRMKKVIENFTRAA